ncbi:U6 snRNA-associated Sm-like protein LSm11 [Oratosquilla oratoria]|uniref:U6 snRNA-associated Sm-like protein LSm11 n=1 Tax=Oratosquilla oratoria TaxID=337810 RepID=UPI003F7734D3
MEPSSSRTDFLSSDFDPRAALKEDNVRLPYPESQEYSDLNELRKAVHSQTFNVTREIEGVYGIGGIPFPPKAKAQLETRNFEPEQGLLEGRKKRQRNVLQRMEDMVGPLRVLRACRETGTRVKVYTRNHSEIRSVITATVVAFDKHWNLVLRDVHELFVRKGKGKTPVLEDDVSRYVRVADLSITGDGDDDEDYPETQWEDPSDRRQKSFATIWGSGPEASSSSSSQRWRPSEGGARGRGRTSRHSLDTLPAGGTVGDDDGSLGTSRSSKRSRSGSRRLGDGERQGRDAVSLRRAQRRRHEEEEEEEDDSKREKGEDEEEERGKEVKEEGGAAKKKRRRRKRNAPQLRERHVNSLFVRGANVVLVAFAHPTTEDVNDGDGAAAGNLPQSHATSFSRQMAPGPSSGVGRSQGRQTPFEYN